MGPKLIPVKLWNIQINSSRALQDTSISASCSGVVVIAMVAPDPLNTYMLPLSGDT